MYTQMHSVQRARSTAGEEGAVRLVSRVDVNGFATGVLQVFCDGAWGLVCDTNFDDRDALVACRQLGFTTGSELRERPQRRFAVPPEARPLSLTHTCTACADCAGTQVQGAAVCVYQNLKCCVWPSLPWCPDSKGMSFSLKYKALHGMQHLFDVEWMMQLRSLCTWLC